jgi:hypothetical protein
VIITLAERYQEPAQYLKKSVFIVLLPVTIIAVKIAIISKIGAYFTLKTAVFVVSSMEYFPYLI